MKCVSGTEAPVSGNQECTVACPRLHDITLYGYEIPGEMWRGTRVLVVPVSVVAIDMFAPLKKKTIGPFKSDRTFLIVV